MSDEVVVSLIVLSWNTREMTIACLDSIVTNPSDLGWELIVIDNASSDGSADAISSRYAQNPRVKVIKNEKNLGFTGGNNQGIEIAKGSIIGLLNSDTLVHPGDLSDLCSYLMSNEKAGVVGPWLTHEDGSPTTSFGYFPTAWSVFTTAFLPGWIWGNSRKALGVVPDQSMKEPMKVDYVSGAAFFIKRKVIDAVGAFDQKTFFAYFEETDWCRRIGQAGWQVMFLPSVKIVHLEGKSFEKMTGHRRIMQYDSAKKFFRKHYSLPMLWWYQFCTVIGSLVKVLYFGLRITLQPGYRDRWLPHYHWNAFVFDLWRRGLGLEKEAGQ
jgi:N-acetylglucosaminyl-diphospho-decaprenol L-rhamnosyltransferase